jgi:hypothetical protein
MASRMAIQPGRVFKITGHREARAADRGDPADFSWIVSSRASRESP